jgi:hypothetical protein
MAVIPGTKYAEGTLPGRTGQQPMSAPSDNGQQIASAVGQLGGVLMDYALDVQKKKMVAEVSQKQREIDEAGWAANEAVTGNEEADKKVWEKFQQDTQRIANSSEYKDVNDETQQHLNSVTPNWEHAFRVKSLGIQEREASDQLELEWSKSLEYGSIEGANKIAENALKLKAITQAQYDDKIKSAPAESHILIASRLLDDANESEGKKDYQAVLDELDKTKDMDLDPRQRQNRQALRLTTEKAKGEVSKALKNDVMDKASKGMPINKIGELIQQTIGLTPEEKTELMKIAVNTSQIWQDKGINYLNETRDPEKLVETYNKIKTKEITTYDQLFKVYSEGETPPFSFGYLQNLENLRMSVTGSGKADLTEMKFRERLMDNFSKNGKLIPSKRGQYQEADSKLTELYKQYGSKPSEMETKFQELIKEENQVRAKEYLSELQTFSVSGIGPVRMKPLGMRGTKPISESKYQVGQTATNPNTGEKMKWDGEKWVKI